MQRKKVAYVFSAAEEHWVGNGFFVSTIFSPSMLDSQLLSPFVLMDHAAPHYFAPSEVPRGVGEHPHRGFETVTFAYQGEIEHRDSAGGGGRIGPGGVQWMTAASGVVHEEKHSKVFSESGGVFEMVQLWVNVPAQKKMSAPRYQAVSDEQVAAFSIGDAQGSLIAGPFQGLRGPVETHSPITVFDLEFQDNGASEFEVSASSTTLLFIQQGAATVSGDTAVQTRDLLVMDPQSPGRVLIEAEAGTRILVLNGEPLGEPVVAAGPFVMNTREQIMQAQRDYMSGKMGHLDG